MILESLPRSESSLLAVKLDTLLLRDLTTQGTIFPFLVSPKTVKMMERFKQTLHKTETVTARSLFYICVNTGEGGCCH